MSERILALHPPYLSAAAAHLKLLLRPEETVEEALVEAEQLNLLLKQIIMKKGVHFLKLFSKPAEGLVDILEVVAQVTGLVIRKYPFLKTYIAVEYAADMLPSRECKN